MSDSQNSIHKVANLLVFFRNELVAAFQKTGLTTTDETQAYLVHMLYGFVKNDARAAQEVGFHKPAAMLLGEAMNSIGERRIEAYRRLGDVSLFSCAFFAQHLARAPVSPDYYRTVGRTAYHNLGELMEFKQPGGAFDVIFNELAGKFDTVVEAVGHVGNKPSIEEQNDVVKLLEHCQVGKPIDVDTLVRLGLLPAKPQGED